ncbi:MAG TPA: hypothetical protein VIY53_14235 [Acidobacteriaceae bacterium]
MAVSHPVTNVGVPSVADERWALVTRIAASQHLKTSPRLREFLFYIARCAIREAPEEATEQQIGIRVFGRPAGYNSSEDSIVRTHARLLRQKLAAYFSEEGAQETVILEVPKGHYLPIFHAREGPRAPEPVAVIVPHGVERTQEDEGFAPTRPWKLWIALGTAILAALLLGAAVVSHPWRRATPQPTAVDLFWRPFLNSDPPLVIYSNALFEGSSTQGLRYAPPETVRRANGDGYVDTYTGIGELASVYTLTRLFDSHHATFLLKRSLLVTWDEAQLRNLIFIGSRAENPSLRVLQPTSDFTMVAGPDSAGVVNVHPLQGEQAVYSRPERPLTTDYAILALQPGVQAGRQMLEFSGLTTFGTQAAVDFVCSPDTMGPLLKKITGPKGEIRPFEAVLQTTIGGGVPLQTRLVTIRVH